MIGFSSKVYKKKMQNEKEQAVDTETEEKIDNCLKKLSERKEIIRELEILFDLTQLSRKSTKKKRFVLLL